MELSNPSAFRNACPGENCPYVPGTAPATLYVLLVTMTGRVLLTSRRP